MSRHTGSNLWYTVYEAYRDRLLVIGSAKECAAGLGWTESTFRATLARVKSGKNRRYCIVVEDLKRKTYKVYGSENTGEPEGQSRKFDVETAKRLHRAGKSDADIARQLDTSSATVWGWRKRNDLPPNCGRGRPRKRDAQ